MHRDPILFKTPKLTSNTPRFSPVPQQSDSELNNSESSAMLQEQVENDMSQQYLEERTEQVKDVEQSIVEISQMYSQLTQLVAEQDSDIQR